MPKSECETGGDTFIVGLPKDPSYFKCRKKLLAADLLTKSLKF